MNGAVQTLRSVLVLLVAAALCLAQGPARPTGEKSPQALHDLIRELVHAGELTGAQVLVGQGDELLLEESFGAVTPGSPKAVDAETMFCIGSTSKPFASTIAMGLVEENKLRLDDPVSRWLPEFKAMRLIDSEETVGAPTLRQVMMHRGGIFSQQNGHMTRAQGQLIRDFRQTLAESVAAIAKESLISRPGSEFAYSGAGYCVVGRVTEAAAGLDIEKLLQQRIAGPLGLKRTSYFPRPGDANVAAGAEPGGDGSKPHSQTPHLLGADLRFPLVGGSVYSTARDLARFSRMIAGQGRLGDVEALSREAWLEMTRRQQPAGETRDYGLGWVLTLEDGADRPTWVGHTGALYSSRCSLKIGLERGEYIVVLYSVSGEDSDAGARINRLIEEVMNFFDGAGEASRN